jgi:hypothetical protein
MKRRPTQLVAMRIVRAYLADVGGEDRADREGMGWTYGPHERRLAQAIERAILDDRAGTGSLRGRP